MSTSPHALLIKQARKGGRARAKAIRNGTYTGSLGGRKPSEETLKMCALVLQALPKATGEDKSFLQAAFRALAPGSVYQSQWVKACGPKLSEADRRSYRGWGPNERKKALTVSKAVLK